VTIHVNAVKEPSSDGKVPVKRLTGSDKCVKAVKEPSSDGTMPVKILESSDNSR
jgi:hypothetical protein